MIAAKARLEDVLSTLVRMIEGQSPGMLCSVLLLSPDGNHILHGAAPSLTDLDHGDLKWKIDFRQVYASVLSGWLRADARQVLGGEFGGLKLIR